MQTRPIPVVTAQRWGEFAARARRRFRPVVIRGAVAGSGAEHWSPRRFADVFRDVTVPIMVDLPSTVPFRERSRGHRATVSIPDVVERIERGEMCYMNQVPVSTFAEFARELRLDHLFPGVAADQMYAVNVWMGGKTRSGLHYDGADNMFLQIFGCKRAFLVRPQAPWFLYPFADCPTKSQVDPEFFDRRRFPRFERCEVWSAELQAGDGLYIPRGWWHLLAATEASISVNCWHGEMLTNADRRILFVASGPRVVSRSVFDFLWHGILGRPYEPRLGGNVPPGLATFKRLKRWWRGTPRRAGAPLNATER
jgi:hypothetical protein